MHNLGSEAMERCFLAGNRCGKTYAGAREASYHLTGQYPRWWKGKRFTTPVDMVAASNTAVSTRDILQKEYLGSIKSTEFGSGAIPKDAILDWTMSRGIGDAVDTLQVRHKSGGTSTVAFKSYEQGREKFQGTKFHFAHLDEEPPEAIMEEVLMRLMTLNGILLLTMTPLMGLTSTVERYWNANMAEGSIVDGRVLIQASWDDADHITEEQKEAFRKTLPPHIREARERGIPSIGEGMVYPVAESSILVERFPIPDYYKQAYAMDFGWHPDPTVAIFGAYDPETDVLYLTKEYRRSEATPASHADALTRLGADWQWGVADPFGGLASSQADGESLIQKYQDEGLKLEPAKREKKLNGVMEVLSMMQEGRLKVFDDMEHWLSEFRKYAYDEKGRPRDKDDHLMDAMRYLVCNFRNVYKSKHDLQKRAWKSTKARLSRGVNWRTV